MILRSWLRNVSQILFSPRGLQSGRRRRRCYPYVEMLGRRLYLTNPICLFNQFAHHDTHVC